MGRLIALAATVLGVLPVTAAAHGGTLVGSTKNSAYALSVAAGEIRLPDGREAVDITAYPIRRASGSPDLDARVTITMSGRTYTGKRLGDGIDVEIPLEEAGDWKRKSFTVALVGSAGTIQLAVAPLLKQGDGPPGWLYPATAVGGLAIIGWSVNRMRRRRDDPTG